MFVLKLDSQDGIMDFHDVSLPKNNPPSVIMTVLIVDIFN